MYPNLTQRPLPCLLIQSFFYDANQVTVQHTWKLHTGTFCQVCLNCFVLLTALPKMHRVVLGCLLFFQNLTFIVKSFSNKALSLPLSFTLDSLQSKTKSLSLTFVSLPIKPKVRLQRFLLLKIKPKLYLNRFVHFKKAKSSYSTFCFASFKAKTFSLTLFFAYNKDKSLSSAFSSASNKAKTLSSTFWLFQSSQQFIFTILFLLKVIVSFPL